MRFEPADAVEAAEVRLQAGQADAEADAEALREIEDNWRDDSERTGVIHAGHLRGLPVATGRSRSVDDPCWDDEAEETVALDFERLAPLGGGAALPLVSPWSDGASSGGRTLDLGAVGAGATASSESTPRAAETSRSADLAHFDAAWLEPTPRPKARGESSTRSSGVRCVQTAREHIASPNPEQSAEYDVASRDLGSAPARQCDASSDYDSASVRVAVDSGEGLPGSSARPSSHAVDVRSEPEEFVAPASARTSRARPVRTSREPNRESSSVPAHGVRSARSDRRHRDEARLQNSSIEQGNQADAAPPHVVAAARVPRARRVRSREREGLVHEASAEPSTRSRGRKTFGAPDSLDAGSARTAQHDPRAVRLAGDATRGAPNPLDDRAARAERDARAVRPGGDGTRGAPNPLDAWGARAAERDARAVRPAARAAVGERPSLAEWSARSYDSAPAVEPERGDPPTRTTRGSRYSAAKVVDGSTTRTVGRQFERAVRSRVQGPREPDSVVYSPAPAAEFESSQDAQSIGGWPEHAAGPAFAEPDWMQHSPARPAHTPRTVRQPPVATWQSRLANEHASDAWPDYEPDPGWNAPFGARDRDGGQHQPAWQQSAAGAAGTAPPSRTRDLIDDARALRASSNAAGWMWLACGAALAVAFVVALRALAAEPEVLPAEPAVIVRAADPAETGFSIQTRPAGAQVLVDGKPTGLITPARVRGLTPGLHAVELKLPGYFGTSLPAVLEPGATLALPEVELRALPLERSSGAADDAAQVTADEARRARRAAYRAQRRAAHREFVEAGALGDEVPAHSE